MKPILSIVVPTKDRYKYLKHLISLIDSFNSKEIELVIQDNSEKNIEIIEFLDKKKYTNIKYFHNKKQLSMSHNSDLAILNSTGEYVCFIGDDDGVTRHIIECVSWMKENDIDALRSTYSLYKWPDYSHSLYNLSGSLSFRDFKKNVIVIDVKQALNRIVNKGFKDLFDMPKVYNGIVKREVLDKIFQIGGTYFPGPSPDMANAVALCFVVGKFVKIDFPIIIGGACNLSGAGIKRYKKLVGRIEDQQFLPSKSKENWEKKIPKVWASQTVWPESGIKALKYMSQDKLIEKINYDYILAYFIVYHFQLWRLGVRLSRNKFKLLCLCIILSTNRYVIALNRIIMMKLFGKLNGMHIVYNINDIEQANCYLLTLEPKFKLEGKI